MLRWLFFVWALLWTCAIAVTALPCLLGLGSAPSGDSSILFGWSAILGLPGWLVVAALTAYRWKQIPAHIKVIQNAPAALSAVMYLGIKLWVW